MSESTAHQLLRTWWHGGGSLTVRTYLWVTATLLSFYALAFVATVAYVALDAARTGLAPWTAALVGGLALATCWPLGRLTGRCAANASHHIHEEWAAIKREIGRGE